MAAVTFSASLPASIFGERETGVALSRLIYRSVLLLGSASKTFTTMEIILIRNIIGSILRIGAFKRIIIVVASKKCTKLSKDGKLTVKKKNVR